ncbi:MAG: hypothetical protein WD009_07505 [Phycisphaeraceae bacterium]
MTMADGQVESLTPGRALRVAWMAWLTLLLVPFFVFLAVIGTVAYDGAEQRPQLAAVFFVVSLVWMLVTLPAAFMLRDYLFRSYWRGQAVDPRSYLKGQFTIWLAVEIGGLLALVGCLVSGTLLPGLLPAAVAFMLFTPFWPKGQAMIETGGASDDDEVYREPR